MDETQLRAQLRAEIEAELRAELGEKQRKAEFDAAFAPVIQSANRERNWERGPASTARPPRTSAAGIIGEALAEQMIAGLPGTVLDEDGYGDGS